MSERDAAPIRDEYPHFSMIKTRWMDNDVYGHVNNVVYYSFFDTVIAEFLYHQGGFRFATANVIGLAVESGCRFRRPLAFPEEVHAGLRVAHLGRSSVRYEVGIFDGEAASSCADGYFVHVFVERETSRPTPIPDGIRGALARIQRSPL
ncbi:MAG: thioesterase family protein [Gammaproteobacteria bacterium]|nr:thioesterase family protein [Gammaproteobacteria bacterium]